MIPAQIPVTSCLERVDLGISQLESSSEDFTVHTGLGSYQLDPKVELGTDRASLFVPMKVLVHQFLVRKVYFECLLRMLILP